MRRDIFTLGHEFVARWEGGYANHANDPGGATNHGVSLRWLERNGIDMNGDGVIDINDIKALTPERAAALFRTYFWDALALDELPPLVAIVVYDGAVNMGRSRAVMQMQAACNRFDGRWLDQDGVPGPNTRSRIRDLCGAVDGQVRLCKTALLEREEFYRRLAAKPPLRNAQGRLIDYKPFLGGWLNRASALFGWLNQLAKDGVR